MPCQVVCISHARGSGGEAVGPLVAARLGFRCLDEEIVALAASREGVDPAVVSDVEHRKSFLARVFSDAGGFIGIDVAAGGAALALDQLGQPLATSSHYRELIRDAIVDVADEGKAVIVSHAASFALAGRDGVLRVLVTASPDVREGRLSTDAGLDEEEAAKAMKKSDAARADYLKRFYGVDRELPTQYDLVVNTDLLTVGQAADVIARTAAALD